MSIDISHINKRYFRFSIIFKVEKGSKDQKVEQPLKKDSGKYLLTRYYRRRKLEGLGEKRLRVIANRQDFYCLKYLTSNPNHLLNLGPPYQVPSLQGKDSVFVVAVRDSFLSIAECAVLKHCLKTH